MNHLNEWQMFSNRYGLSKREDAPEWAYRHRLISEPIVPTRHRCNCPGSSLSIFTCRSACTQEDLLCDECRQWCIGQDAAGNQYQLAQVPR